MNTKENQTRIQWNSTQSNNVNWYTTVHKILLIHEVKLKSFQLYLVQCCRRKSQVARAVPSVIHKVKIFHTCSGDVTLYCATVSNVCE